MSSLKWLPDSYFVDGDKLPSIFHAKQVEAIEYLFLKRRGEIYVSALDSKTEAEWMPINIEVLFRPLFDPSEIFTEG